MTTVAVAGAGGRMGQEVCRAVAGAPDLELAGAADPKIAGTALRDVAGGEVPALTVVPGVGELDPTGLDVMVDFTVADAARANLRWCADQGVHAVVGTTGLSGDDLARARRLFEASAANAVLATNFAIGAVLLLRFCELAAPLMDAVEVVELHHDAKRDAPSGTALQTAERMAAARTAAGSPPWPADPTTQLVLEGARGATAPGGVHVHAVRLPGLVAHEEVIFGALGQSLSLRHDSYDRRSFMPGVLLAVRQVSARSGLTVGIESLLGL